MIVRYGFLTPERDISIANSDHNGWISLHIEEVKRNNILKYKAWINESKEKNISDFCMKKLGWIFVGLYSESANIRKIRVILNEENAINNWQEQRISEYLMYGFEVDALR